MALPNLHAFLDGVLNILFEPEIRRLASIVDELDAANREIRGHTVMGFMHNGKAYLPKAATMRPKQFPALAFTLTNRAAVWCADEKQVGEDKQLIKQVLWLVTKDCTSMEAVRDALPESIIELVPTLRSIQRTNEDGYTIKGDPKMYAQYLKIRDKIDVYWACRMIY